MNNLKFVPVIVAIVEELDWQELAWGGSDPFSESGTGAFDRSVDEYTLYINRYAQRLAAENCDGTAEFERKMHTVRKIAALCVACMSEHGTFTRDQENDT